ncbi:MAG: M24 family metallopeptidase, partial [Mycobacterium sp.]
FARSESLYDRMLGACCPGAPVRELLAAYEAVGEPLPPMPVAHGLGLGFDPPVVSEGLSAADDRLDAGMVLAITGYVWEEGFGTVFRRDTVHITKGGAEVLTASPSWGGLS